MECRKSYCKPDRILRSNICSVSPTKTVGLFTFHPVHSFLRNMIGIFGEKEFFVSSIIKNDVSSCSQARDMGGSSISDGLVSRVQDKWSNLRVKDNLSENFHSSASIPHTAFATAFTFAVCFTATYHLF